MICKLVHDDYPQVLHIWQTCFGDSEDYVRFFWQHAFPHCRGIGCHVDDRLVSMLFMLPGTLMPNHVPVHYIYAVATLPEYRNRGLAQQLLQHAARDTGALALYPATEQLQRYYAKQGFVPAFRKQNCGVGKFDFAPAMQAYMQAEAKLVNRDLTERDAFGGMLLPLDGQAREWLVQTKQCAYLPYTLE
ncbi:MAG: GNAT family N-acetyltransferase [Oscillospiraceae bacterium]|nr:GNAT family N-acetyltransferase [Oscillospiraceae bacterium]